MRSARLAGAVVLVALTIDACAAGMSSRDVAVQIGPVKISRRAVAERMAALAPEHYVPDAPYFRGCVRRKTTLEPEAVRSALPAECRRDYEALKQRALASLISEQWRAGAAGTPALRTVPTVTDAEVATYYRRHISRYERPEVRYADALEHIPTSAAARRLRRQFASGRLSLASPIVHHVVYERHVPDAIPGQAALAKSIFAAKPHVLSGVVPFDRMYAFFEVTRIVPAVVRPLRDVASSIRATLIAEASARTARAWQTRRIARTACRPGYVIDLCREYRAARR